MNLMNPTHVVTRYYAAFNAGDRPAMLALLAEDVVHDVNQGERQLGKLAFANFLGKMDDCYREILRDIVVLSDGATRVAAEYVVHGTYLATDEGLPPARGQSYVLPGGAFFVVEDGLIRRVTNYYNLPDWLRQVEG